MTNSKGKLIAAMGLPGSGKSSVISLVAQKYNAHCFLEPEESEWTDAVHMRDQVGHVTALTWFRSVRVPLLYKADTLRREGHVVFIDSYYDKLIARYLGRKGMEWLISPNDKYYSIIEKLSLLDYSELPNADCVISFHVSQKIWYEMIRRRNRALDESSALHKTFHTQEYFIEAASVYCKEAEIPHIEFDNDTDGVDAAADVLLQRLVNERILSEK